MRIFPLWDDFQPSPNEVSLSNLKNLVTVCDLAERYHLKLDVTFFAGHMSGPNWVPRWMLRGDKPEYVRQVISGGKIFESGYLNPYSDELVLAA